MTTDRAELILEALERGPATAREIVERTDPTRGWGFTPKEIGQACRRHPKVVRVGRVGVQSLWDAPGVDR